jgi:hypothetical protein
MKKNPKIEKMIIEYQSKYMPDLDAVKIDNLSHEEQVLLEKRLDELFLQTSKIHLSKEFLRNITNRTKSFMDSNFEKLDKINIRNKKIKSEINKYKKRLYKCWESVKRSNYNVMEKTNNLLELMKFSELDSAINKYNTTNSKEQFDIIHNLGFSKEDGFEEDPSGTINIVYQVSVFNLISSILELHDSITYFVKHQADIIYLLEPDPQKRNRTINDFYSELFPQELTRKQCFEAIINVFNQEGIVDFSESYIKKQLSNWNVYQPSSPRKRKRKKNGPLPGYENAKRSKIDKFEEWVKNTYIPYHRMKNKNRSFSSRNQEKKPFDENSPSYVDLDAADEIRKSVDDNIGSNSGQQYSSR